MYCAVVQYRIETRDTTTVYRVTADSVGKSGPSSEWVWWANPLHVVTVQGVPPQTNFLGFAHDQCLAVTTAIFF